MIAVFGSSDPSDPSDPVEIKELARKLTEPLPVRRDTTIDYHSLVSAEPIDYRFVDPNRLPSDLNDKVLTVGVWHTVPSPLITVHHLRGAGQRRLRYRLSRHRTSHRSGVGRQGGPSKTGR